MSFYIDIVHYIRGPFTGEYAIMVEDGTECVPSFFLFSADGRRLLIDWDWEYRGATSANRVRRCRPPEDEKLAEAVKSLRWMIYQETKRIASVNLQWSEEWEQSIVDREKYYADLMAERAAGTLSGWRDFDLDMYLHEDEQDFRWGEGLEDESWQECEDELTSNGNNPTQ